MTAPSFVLLLSIVIAVSYVAIALTSWLRVRPTPTAVSENEEPSAIEVEGTCGIMSTAPETEELPESLPRWSELAVRVPASKAMSAVAPHDPHSTAILERFFDGKRCVLCHCLIPPVAIDDPKPGFLNPVSHQLVAWESLPVHDLQAIFRTHLPICSVCKILEAFRDEHRDLIADRQRSLEIRQH
jgi:hypothetical protein